MKPKIVPILERLGVKHSKGRKWACVWCNSSDALHVRRDEVTVRCYSCGKYGDAADVWAAFHGCGLGEALREVGMSKAPPKVYRPSPIKKKERSKMKDWSEGFTRLWGLLPVLTRSPQTQAGKACIEYLNKHGLSQKQAANLPLRIIPDRSFWKAAVLKAFGGVPECLQWQSGALMPVLPAIGFGYMDGDVVRCVRFRQVGARVKTSAPSAVYPGLFDLTRYGDTSSGVYVCEGEPDALSLAAASMASVGVPGAGVWGRPAEWERINAKRWVICIQGDDSAREWAARVKDEIYRAGGGSLWEYRAPDGWDIADMMAKDSDRALTSIASKTMRCK